MLIKFSEFMIDYFDFYMIVSTHTMFTCFKSLLNVELPIRDNVANICLIPKVVEKQNSTFDNSELIFPCMF